MYAVVINDLFQNPQILHIPCFEGISFLRRFLHHGRCTTLVVVVYRDIIIKKGVILWSSEKYVKTSELMRVLH